MTENYPFSHLPPTPTEHFKLYYYAAVLQIIEQTAANLGSFEIAFERFPFLIGYNDELAENGLAGKNINEAAAWWLAAIDTWEQAIPTHLPLRALRQAVGLDHTAITLLIGIGIVEEDARFGVLFEALQNIPGQQRPTIGLLNGWWQSATDARSVIRKFQQLGLVQVANPEALRQSWALQVPEILWDALQGKQLLAFPAGFHYRAISELSSLDDLILPADLKTSVARIPTLANTGKVKIVMVRSPRHNSRRTLLGAVAHALGMGTLGIAALKKTPDECWQLIGPLATLLNALPIITLETASGENAGLPQLPGYDGLIGIVLEPHAGMAGSEIEGAVTLTLGMPDMDERRQHWHQALGNANDLDLDQICQRMRLGRSTIRRMAGMAQTQAELAGRSTITSQDIQQASRSLNRQQLDTLATRIKTSGDWRHLSVTTDTLDELQSLESRCCQRERLSLMSGSGPSAQLNCGVRALFTGPSGTGKTLAARLLAAALEMDLYRLDLSAVVNKYIGETEKNLNQVFSLAEELDVILLLDEGDALLTQRTSIQTSNDRYANLETNFLLQRLESFEGILIITTNASDNIDSAFQRRMDVVIDFHAPDFSERWAIWQMHLPAQHEVAHDLLEELAHRCAFNGGQIRNAVLHASLLALNNGGILTSLYLEQAVRREYRKMGAVCPLKKSLATWD